MDLEQRNRLEGEDKLSRMIIIYITLALVLLYGVWILGVVKLNIHIPIKPSDFIRVFNVIFAFLAVGSCLLCYNSTKKEELFIVSLMYIIFAIDLAIGNVDELDLNIAALNMKGYIAISTSLMRVSILMIATFSFRKTRRFIDENKILVMLTVLISAICFGYLENNSIIFPMTKGNVFFIEYNVFLMLVYTIVSIKFFVKSKKEDEYIYSVIGASILMFAIKAIYAIIGAENPFIELKYVSISITYIGFIVLIGGLFLELTSHIRRNKILEEEKKIFYNLVEENKNSCIFIYDKHENLTYANKKLKKYLSFDKNCTNYEIKNKISLIIKNIDKNIIDEINECKNKYGCWNGKIEFEDENKSILDCSIQLIKVKNNDVKTVITFNDVTEKYRNEKYLIEYEKMKSHEKIKSEFFANISHELRTPLNIFYSTVQLLDIKSKNSERDFVETYINHRQSLKINCQRMLRLINNIVDITKIDVGFTKPNIVNCDIVRLVEDITLSVINYANPKDINIVFDTDEEELTIKCDPAMIERAMLNLLSNAIKFTGENGNIDVNIHMNKDWVQIIVSDDGVGVPTNMQDLVFERFVQADKSLTRMNEGSGIGLSIVKSIVELNEGEIYLDSDGENGSEFEILLPNKKLLGDCTEEETTDYKVDLQKIELELSDIYKLYT